MRILGLAKLVGGAQSLIRKVAFGKTHLVDFFMEDGEVGTYYDPALLLTPQVFIAVGVARGNLLYKLPTCDYTGDLTLPGSLTIPGNLTFTGNARRIKGNFDNATRANRTLFQTSTAGTGTSLGAIPNATGTSSSFTAHYNPDPDNSALLTVQAGTGGNNLNSTKSGTGAQNPLNFQIAGTTVAWCEITNDFWIQNNLHVLGTAAITGNITGGTYNGQTISSTAAFTGTLSVATGLTVTAGGATINGGNLAFGTTSQRVTGDFSNATVPSRVLFQSSTVNGNTNVGAIPNGTATASRWIAYNNADAGNAGFIQIQAQSGAMVVTTGANGTGTALDLTLQANAFTGLQVMAATQNTRITKVVDSYNGYSLVGLGIGVIVGRYDSGASPLTAAVGSTALVASVPADGAYEVSYVASVITAATTSSTLGGTAGFTVVATDPHDSVAKTTKTVATDQDTRNTTATTNCGLPKVVYAKAGTAINFTFDYTSSGATAMAYRLRAIVRYLGPAS